MRPTLAVAVVGLALAPATAGADISVARSGVLGQNGWYVSPVTVTWTVSGTPDPTSACDPLVTMYSSDTKGKYLECRLLGTTEKYGFTLGIDMTAPLTPGASAARSPDGGSWYRQPVAITWSGTDATSGIGSCTAVTYGGPDSANAQVSGNCRDRAGNLSPSSTFSLQYDGTPPQIVSAVPDRPPDRAGWYVKPVQYALQATDNVSGVSGCEPLTYRGPDDAGATATGTCRDRAGNAAHINVALRYDATAPTFSKLSASTRPGAATLRWTASTDTTGVTVKRKPGPTAAKSFGGASGRLEDTGLTDGRRYTYVVTATDAAGNTSSRTLKRTPPSMLLSPAPGARVKRAPTLRWKKRKDARYYNVQLYRGSRKILSSWPRRTRMALHRTWRYGGHRQRLVAGTYRWYVWPGYGPRAQHKYGRLMGKRTFRVRR
jgi:hypothetical protein